MSLFRHDAPEAGPPWRHFAVCATGWICLGAALFWILHRIWPALFLPWWFNTDEVVFYNEVIRQLRLDPRQTFFDIPGTPFMALTSVLTALWWAAARLAGLTGFANPSDFAFANVQGVFTLMRALTLGMYAGAVALTFDLFRRCAGTLTAILAALLFASLPIHVHYSHFVRTESLGLVLCFGAIWMVLYSRWRGTPGVYFWAGAMAGVAMAARFHFALAGVPVILAIFFLRDREKLPPEPNASMYRPWYGIAGALAALFIAGGLVTVILKAGLIGGGWLTDTMMLTTPAGQTRHFSGSWIGDLMILTTPGGQTHYPGAKQAVARLWLLLGLGALAILLVHGFAKGRRWVWPAINPFTLLLGAGFTAGFLLSHPTFLWRGEYQLRSIQAYMNWTDPNLLSLGPIRSWWNVASFYFTAALPERWLQAAFLAGTAIILWRRQAVHLAFLGGAAVCFFAHPVTMKLWPHHVIPWLPFVCFVAAAPAGLLGGWLTRRYRHPAFAAAIVLLSASAVIWACAPRLRRADEYLAISRSRTDEIGKMNRWLSKNVPAGAYVLVSYYALNEDGMLSWIEDVGVPVPGFMKKPGSARVWRLDRGAVDGQMGFVCISPADIVLIGKDLERQNPGWTYNPFENSAFQPLARFGDYFYQLHVLKFDFRRNGGP